MTRHWQPGDRVEWTVTLGNADKVLHGVIETVGTGKHAGIVMVRQDGYAKSHNVSLNRLRDSGKTKTLSVPRGGEVA